MRRLKIVSGGQTGVDRAALDVAMELGLSVGGWCPKGRLAEDGSVPEKYPLTETPAEYYEQRTEWNARDSDATLILNFGPILTGGTAYTRKVAERYLKPVLVVDLADAKPAAAKVRAWLRERQVRALNVAGPRESKNSGVYREAKRFLETLFRAAPKPRPTPDVI